MSTSDECEWNSEEYLDVELDQAHSCDRRTADHGSFCELHSPGSKIDPSDLREFLEDERTLVGVTIDEIDLRDEFLGRDGNDPIDLTGARIRKLSIDDATIDARIVLRHANVQEISAVETRFETGLDCRSLECDRFDASDSTIDGKLFLEDAAITEDLTLDGIEVDCVRAANLSTAGLISLRRCSVTGNSALEAANGAGAGASVDCRRLECARFDATESTIDGNLILEDAVVGGDLILDSVSVERLKASALETEGLISCRRCSIAGPSTLAHAVAGDGACFDRAEIGAEVIAMNATFDSDLRFEETDLRGRVEMIDVNVNGDLNFVRADFGSERAVFSDAIITGRAKFDYATSTGRIAFLPLDDKSHRDPAKITERLSFENADLRRLELQGVRVNDEIAMCEAALETVDGSRLVCGGDLDASGVIVQREFALKEASVDGLRIDDARFHGVVDFVDLDVWGDVVARHVKYNSDADWREGVVEGESTFDESRFNDSAAFDGREFRSEGTFHGARFGAVATFEQAAFLDSVSFCRETEDDPTPPPAFESDVSFHDTSFDRAIFTGSSFRGTANFDGVTFGSGPSSAGTETDLGDGGSRDSGHGGDATPTPANFEDATFDGVASFEGVSFGGSIQFDRASFAELSFDVSAAPSREQVVFRRAEIDVGEVYVEDRSGTAIELDFTLARLGDVDVRARDRRGDVFTHCKIDRTEFDGFNFIPYTRELRQRRWNLHTVAPAQRDEGGLRRKFDEWVGGPLTYLTILREGGDARRYERLRTTYQYAKNGATLVGQNEPASGFFRREMVYRGRQLACEYKDGGRFTSQLKSLGTVSFGITSKYGESGIRVTLFSGFVVVLFTVLYLAAGNPPAESVALSLGAFATLLVGGVGASAGGTTVLLASLQGFVGALLVALLLFTLTRSIRR